MLSDISILKYVLLYYFAISIITALVLGIDKWKAKTKRWRTRESTIFLFGLVGGFVGGLLGMKIFSHKTKKPIFYVVFIGCAAIHIVLWALINMNFYNT